MQFSESECSFATVKRLRPSVQLFNSSSGRRLATKRHRSQRRRPDPSVLSPNHEPQLAPHLPHIQSMGHTFEQLVQFGKDSKVDLLKVLVPEAFDESGELWEEEQEYPQANKQDTECQVGFSLHCFTNRAVPKLCIVCALSCTPLTRTNICDWILTCNKPKSPLSNINWFLLFHQQYSKFQFVINQ